MSAAHTPGHWVASGFIVNSGAPNYTPIADCETDTEWMAENARLIAAAPELLAALVLAEDVLARRPYSSEIWPNGTHPFNGIEQIRAAIAKATGEIS